MQKGKIVVCRDLIADKRREMKGKKKGKTDMFIGIQSSKGEEGEIRKPS